MFGRLGGEEFALILTGVDEGKALEICERIRASLGQAEINVGSAAVNLIASFGCAELLPGDLSINDVLNRPDKAMYEAKGAGRNRVVMKRCGII